MEVFNRIFPYLFAAIMFMAVYPVYAKSTDYVLPDHRAVPVTIWILCEGKPVGIVSTASIGYFFGDALAMHQYEKDDPAFVNDVLNESYKLSNHFHFNLSASKVVECSVK